MKDLNPMVIEEGYSWGNVDPGEHGGIKAWGLAGRENKTGRPKNKDPRQRRATRRALYRARGCLNG